MKTLALPASVAVATAAILWAGDAFADPQSAAPAEAEAQRQTDHGAQAQSEPAPQDEGVLAGVGVNDAAPSVITREGGYIPPQQAEKMRQAEAAAPKAGDTARLPPGQEAALILSRRAESAAQ